MAKAQNKTRELLTLKKNPTKKPKPKGKKQPKKNPEEKKKI